MKKFKYRLCYILSVVNEKRRSAEDEEKGKVQAEENKKRDLPNGQIPLLLYYLKNLFILQ
mgnify:CR=1 FL=1